MANNFESFGVLGEFSYFVSSNENRVFSDAIETCNRLLTEAASPVSFESVEEFDFVLSLARETFGQSFWMGIQTEERFSDFPDLEEYKFIDGTSNEFLQTDFGTFPWNDVTPGDDSNCAVLLADTGLLEVFTCGFIRKFPHPGVVCKIANEDLGLRVETLENSRYLGVTPLLKLEQQRAVEYCKLLFQDDRATLAAVQSEEEINFIQSLVDSQAEAFNVTAEDNWVGFFNPSRLDEILADPTKYQPLNGQDNSFTSFAGQFPWAADQPSANEDDFKISQAVGIRNGTLVTIPIDFTFRKHPFVCRIDDGLDFDVVEDVLFDQKFAITDEPLNTVAILINKRCESFVNDRRGALATIPQDEIEFSVSLMERAGVNAVLLRENFLADNQDCFQMDITGTISSVDCGASLPFLCKAPSNEVAIARFQNATYLATPPTIQAPFYEAKSRCRGLMNDDRANLASFESLEEYDFIISLIDRVDNFIDFSQRFGYQLGIHGPMRYGTVNAENFLFVDGIVNNVASLRSTLPWDFGEPSRPLFSEINVANIVDRDVGSRFSFLDQRGINKLRSISHLREPFVCKLPDSTDFPFEIFEAELNNGNTRFAMPAASLALTFDEANRECKKIMGDDVATLASIESQEELDIIVSLAEQARIQERTLLAVLTGLFRDRGRPVNDRSQFKFIDKQRNDFTSLETEESPWETNRPSEPNFRRTYGVVVIDGDETREDLNVTKGKIADIADGFFGTQLVTFPFVCSVKPTVSPTTSPTFVPTTSPTFSPTQKPTTSPSFSPTDNPNTFVSDTDESNNVGIIASVLIFGFVLVVALVVVAVVLLKKNPKPVEPEETKDQVKALKV